MLPICHHQKLDRNNTLEHQIHAILEVKLIHCVISLGLCYPVEARFFLSRNRGCPRKRYAACIFTLSTLIFMQNAVRYFILGAYCKTRCYFKANFKKLKRSNVVFRCVGRKPRLVIRNLNHKWMSTPCSLIGEGPVVVTTYHVFRQTKIQ